MQWPPDGLTIRAKKWFLGVGFLGAPPISVTHAVQTGGGATDAPPWRARARGPRRVMLQRSAPRPQRDDGKR